MNQASRDSDKIHMEQAMAAANALSTRKARTPAGLVPTLQRTQYLAFGLAGEAFAMEIRFVKEVLQFEDLTQVPLMPPFIRGVINLRGAVVPVIDLSIRFGRPPTEISRRTCIVILETSGAGGRGSLGVMVDSVSEVLELAASDIEPSPSFGTDARAEFILGVGKVGTRFVILLDVHHILSREEFSAIAGEATTEPAGP
jgi:purine-binding chemotaxis protein CheW